MKILLSCMGQGGWKDAFRAHAEVVTLEEGRLAGEPDLAFDTSRDTFPDLCKRLPAGFVPDLCVFTSPEYSAFPAGIEESPYPTVCWLGDMHLRAEASLSISRFFDLTIVPEAAAERMFKAAGIESVVHFPFYAGDPAIYRKLHTVEKEIDVSFVGALDPVIHRRRCRTIERLLAEGSGLRIRIEAGVYGDAANRIYNASKIVFNQSVRGDLNMRLFETMLSGSLALYEDDNPQVGTHFRDREHLVLYNDENLIDLVRHFARADREREEIAASGCALAQREHTMAARVGQLLRILQASMPRSGQRGVLDDPPADRHRHMAMARIAQGAQELAMREMASALEAGSPTAATLNDLGVAEALAGNQAGVEDDFRQSLEIDPNAAAPLLNLGLWQVASGDHGGAAETFESLLAAIESGASFEGMVLSGPGGSSRFHLEREKAIAAHPAAGSPGFADAAIPLFRWMAHTQLGAVAAASGSDAEARLHYAKAMNLVPDCGVTAYKLGMLAGRRGKLELSRGLLGRAVAQEPFFTAAQVALVETALAQGSSSEAAYLSEAFARTNPLIDSRSKAALQQAAASGEHGGADERPDGPPEYATPGGRGYAAEVERMMVESLQSWAGLEQVRSEGDYYDSYWAQNHPRADVERWVIDQVFGGPERLKGQRILDVGCGTGALLEMLHASNEVVGLDASETGVEQAARRGVQVEKCDCSRERFPFDDDAFDIVVFLGTAEHLSDPQFCLEEIRRVLRDGGRLVTSCPNLRLHHVPRPFYPSLFEFDEFNDFLKVNGFWIERIFCQGSILDPESVSEEHLRAEEWIHDCLLAKKTRPEVHAELGEDFWNRGKMVEARDCFLRAIEVGPEHPDGYYWLGRYFAWQNEFFSRSAYYVSLGLPELFSRNARRLYQVARELGLQDPRKLPRVASEPARPSPDTSQASPGASHTPSTAAAAPEMRRQAPASQPRPLRILTTLWHEAYMTLLAKTGHCFDLIPCRGELGPFGSGWTEASRPQPANITVLDDPEDAIRRAGDGYDLFLAQAARDIPIMRRMKIPRVFMSHNMLNTELGRIDDPAELARARKELAPLLEGASLVFNDERKREQWGFEGTVIPGAVDPDDYGGWTGEVSAVLRVGNLMRERDFMLGFSVQERICSGGIPSTIVGYNPSVASARHAGSFDELRSVYASHRVFLNTTAEEFEAGYNLAMLEAMATGMPVVALYHPRSPIVDGRNGFISGDIDQLRQRIQELLADRDLAARLGAEARRTVIEHFNIEGFVRAWQRVFADAIRSSGAARAA